MLVAPRQVSTPDPRGAEKNNSLDLTILRFFRTRSLVLPGRPLSRVFEKARVDDRASPSTRAVCERFT